jgi:hypothetical protein
MSLLRGVRGPGLTLKRVVFRGQDTSSDGIAASFFWKKPANGPYRARAPSPMDLRAIKLAPRGPCHLVKDRVGSF